MRLATLRGGDRDGTLVAVSSDGGRALRPREFLTLQAALDDWREAAPVLQEAFEELERDVDSGEPVKPQDFHAPLPRAYQYAEASTYLPHMERIRASRGMTLPPEHTEEPIAYQSGADTLMAPEDPIVIADEEVGLDLEATIAVVTGDVPRGVAANDVPEFIRLVVLTNDYTLRNVMPLEYAKGVGPYRAKPTRPFAPFAVTPEGLGELWSGTLLHATVKSWVNDELLGELDASADCAFDFGQVIAYLAQTRRLGAGTIVGSGTVSNRDTARGFGCLMEKRAVEQIERGEATTSLLRFGDRIRVEAFDSEGHSLFGGMENVVAQPQEEP